MVRFLIIRFSSIGDIILTTPVVRCLKQQVENAEVHFLTKPVFASLLKYNSYIDKLLLLKTNLNDLINEIKHENYDYIIDLHKNIRTTIIKNKLNILSFTFNKLNFEKWLLINFKINKLPNVHIVDRYFKAVELFDVKYDGKGLDLFIPPFEEVELKNLPNFLHSGYISIAVGAKHETKRIPPELLSKIINKVKYPVVLLGDNKDDYYAKKIISLSDFPYIYNSCGKYNLLQSASLVKQSKLIITADTGLMHIAAALSKKIISIWGNTIPQFGMYPFTNEANYKIFEVKNLPCRPCSKLGFEKCPKKHFKCMNNQNIEDIVNQTIKFLS